MWVVRLLATTGLLGIAAAMIGALSPGGVGQTDAVEVTTGASASAYRSVGRAVADAPSWLATLVEAATEGTLLVLGALLAWTCWTAVRRRDSRLAAGAALTGIGTVAAYLISEAMKLVVDEERPCRALGGDSLAECPAVGDWSFPSNHATLAAGLAVGLAMSRPRLAVATLPLAALAAVLRVVAGVHYPHDVLAGAILGAAVVAATLLICLSVAQIFCAPLIRWLASRAGRLVGNDAGLVRHDGGGRPVVHAQPGQNRAHVRFDGALDQVQAPGDLPVRQPTA